jgi:hypothetical protein
MESGESSHAVKAPIQNVQIPTASRKETEGLCSQCPGSRLNPVSVKKQLSNGIGENQWNPSPSRLAKREVPAFLCKGSLGSLWFPKAHSPMMENDMSLFRKGNAAMHMFASAKRRAVLGWLASFLSLGIASQSFGKPFVSREWQSRSSSYQSPDPHCAERWPYHLHHLQRHARASEP